MRESQLFGFSIRKGAAVAACIFAFSPQLAEAQDSLAQRCDWRGCAYIECNYTGDRCHYYRIGPYGDYHSDYGYGYGYGHGYGHGYGDPNCYGGDDCIEHYGNDDWHGP